MKEQEKSRTIPIVLGGGLAIAIGVAVFLLIPAPQMAPRDAPTVAAPPESIAPATPEVVVAAPQEPDAPVPPEFDTFRLEADGAMVIAGRAAPGQVVDIMLAGEAIDRVTADVSGNFVALPIADPSDIPRRLSLLADPDGDATGSTTSYMVAPISPPRMVAAAPQADAAVADEEPLQTASDDETAAPATAPLALDMPEAETVVTAPPPPPTVLQTGEDGVRVVQGGPSLVAPEQGANVALDAITYDPEGQVQLSGRATGDGSVRVYLDNQPLTTSPVAQGGDWRIDLPEIETGVYTLRIDEVDEEGDVVSRLETPFKREEPQEVAATMAEETSVDGFEVAFKTVQPGATLWAIAEENLGSGIFYVEVFEANADLIRDPDLIYPGQIFRIPEIEQ